MTIVLNGNPGASSLKFTAPTPAESDFALTALSIDVLVSGGSDGPVTVKDAVYDSITGATTDRCASLSASVPVRFESLNTGIGTVSSGGFVSRVASGTVGILAHGPKGTKRADVTLSRLTGQSSQTFNHFVAGSLGEHLAAMIDNRLAGKTPSVAKLIYTNQDHNAPMYDRNPDCWAADIDLTPLSPWNTFGANLKAGTLISPRHVLFAKHFSEAVGMQLRFIAANNVVVTRTVAALTAVAGNDIMIGCLDSDVPNSIGFCKVLPTTWHDKIASAANAAGQYSAINYVPYPAFYTDQEEKALVCHWAGAWNNGGSGDISLSYNNAIYGPTATPTGTRGNYWEDVISGDSGNPTCLIINDELVVLMTFLGASGGPFITDYTSQVNAIMTAQGGGYQLTPVDLSAFPSY